MQQPWGGLIVESYLAHDPTRPAVDTPTTVTGCSSTPPATPGAYKKKCEESGEVIAMIDSVITELDMEMTEAETEEKLAQEEYKELMATEEYVNQLHAEYEWIVQ